jgi:hypothetical protein
VPIEAERIFLTDGQNRQSEELEQMLGGSKTKYYTAAPEYGDRAFRISGKWGSAIFSDQGNGWAGIMKLESFDAKHLPDLKKIIAYKDKHGWEE